MDKRATTDTDLFPGVTKSDEARANVQSGGIFVCIICCNKHCVSCIRLSLLIERLLKSATHLLNCKFLLFIFRLRWHDSDIIADLLLIEPFVRICVFSSCSVLARINAPSQSLNRNANPMKKQESRDTDWIGDQTPEAASHSAAHLGQNATLDRLRALMNRVHSSNSRLHRSHLRETSN